MVQALKYRRVIKGDVCESERIRGLTAEEAARIGLFLAEWKDDTVLAVALHFDELTARHIQMLVDCGQIRPEQLQRAFEIFLNCWSQLAEEVKIWECWLPIHTRLRELVLLKDEYKEWFLFPKLQRLISDHEGIQPGLPFPGPFSTPAF
jgi:hypothetical protein